MSYRDQVSDLFLKIEKTVGTSNMSAVVLDALGDAIHDFKEKGEEDFFQQFYELFEVVKNTQPRIALVIDNFYDIWEELIKAKERSHPEGHLYWERKILKCIRASRKSTDDEKDSIVKTGLAQIKNKDVILIHGISGTVLKTVMQARKKGKKFRVIVAEQESEKTRQLIKRLAKNKVDFQVVPEYMLSHVEADITKVFLGAVTINSQMHVVAEAGTNAIVSEFHLQKKPIYLFVSTRKFSLWKSRDSHHTYKLKSTKIHDESDNPIQFERIKFSHDRVPLKLYDVFVTEQGKLNAKQIANLYKKKFAERQKWRDEFFQD